MLHTCELCEVALLTMILVHPDYTWACMLKKPRLTMMNAHLRVAVSGDC